MPARAVRRYGLHDTFHCTVNRAARCFCVIPWDDGPASASVAERPIAEDAAAASTHAVDRNWRLLTGHDSGNILLFDPRMPHLKPILTIQFQPFSNVTPRRISVLPLIGLLAVTRSDGTVQLLSMITNRSRIMKSAIDPTKKSVRAPHPPAVPRGCSLERGGAIAGGRVQEIMDGVVELQQAGCVLHLHDKRIDHVSVSRATGDMATATLRGNVSFWSQRLFDEKATEAGLMKDNTKDQLARDEAAPVFDSGHGEALFRVTKQDVRPLPFGGFSCFPVRASDALSGVVARARALRLGLGLKRREAVCRTASTAARCSRTRTSTSWTTRT